MLQNNNFDKFLKSTSEKYDMPEDDVRSLIREFHEGLAYLIYNLNSLDKKFRVRLKGFGSFTKKMTKEEISKYKK